MIFKKYFIHAYYIIYASFFGFLGLPKRPEDISENIMVDTSSSSSEHPFRFWNGKFPSYHSDPRLIPLVPPFFYSQLAGNWTYPCYGADMATTLYKPVTDDKVGPCYRDIDP